MTVMSTTTVATPATPSCEKNFFEAAVPGIVVATSASGSALSDDVGWASLNVVFRITVPTPTSTGGSAWIGVSD